MPIVMDRQTDRWTLRHRKPNLRIVRVKTCETTTFRKFPEEGKYFPAGYMPGINTAVCRTLVLCDNG